VDATKTPTPTADKVLAEKPANDKKAGVETLLARIAALEKQAEEAPSTSRKRKIEINSEGEEEISYQSPLSFLDSPKIPKISIEKRLLLELKTNINQQIGHTLHKLARIQSSKKY
jgi:hypothetical protein